MRRQRHSLPSAGYGCLACVAGLAALATSSAMAGPFDRDHVARDAAWIMHIDVEALNDSVLGTIINEHGETIGLEAGNVDEFREMTGFDVMKDLYSLTSYGLAGDLEEKGILIAETSGAIEEAIDRMAELDEYTVEHTRLGERDVVAISEGEGERVYLAIERRRSGRRLVFMGQDRYMLTTAMDVAAGDEPSIDDETPDWLDGVEPRPGSIYFLAAGDLDTLPGERASQIAQLSKAMTIDVGERNHAMFGHAVIAAGDRRDANNIALIVQGLLAFGRLMVDQDPELEPLADILYSINVGSEGERINMSIEFDLDPVLEDLERKEREAAHQHREDGEHGGDG